MSIYTAIKDIAVERKISIYRIEKDLKYPNGLIYKWNRSVPRADTLQDVADYLGVTSAFILHKAKED